MQGRACARAVARAPYVLRVGGVEPEVGGSLALDYDTRAHLVSQCGSSSREPSRALWDTETP